MKLRIYFLDPLIESFACKLTARVFSASALLELTYANWIQAICFVCSEVDFVIVTFRRVISRVSSVDLDSHKLV